MRTHLATGDWLTPERIKVYSAMMIALAAFGLAGIVVTSTDWLDAFGRPLGTDFSNVWSAGRMALDGAAAAAYDPIRQHAVQQEIFGADVPFYGWHYPPFFLIIATALATLPYPVAWGVWMAATLPAYVAAVRRITQLPLTMLVALAFPAVFVNIAHGQNGFLTAALISGALLILDRRPILAGVMIGCLAYKPQFGVLIPLALAISGRWMTFASASATVLGLAATSTAVYGFEIWQAFLDSTDFTRSIVLEAGGTGWHKIQSVFSAVRMFGGSIELAYTVQAMLGLMLALIIAVLWRSNTAFALKAAGLIVASVLITPYALDYDLMLLAPAGAWFAAHGLRQGFLPYEKTALAVVWIAPLVSRLVADVLLLPLGLLAMLLMLTLILRRVWHERATAPTTSAPRGVPRHAEI